MNISSIKKQLVAQSLRSVSLVLIAGVLAALVYFLDDSAQEKRKKLENDLNLLRQQTNNLNTQLEKSSVSLPRYQALQARMKSPGLELDRDKLKVFFDATQKKLNFGNFKASVSAPQVLTEDKYKKPAIEISRSEITLDFTLGFDEDAYLFLNKIPTDMPGIVSIAKFALVLEKKTLL